MLTSALLVVVSTLSLSVIGLPRIAGGNPIAAAASCTKFFESNISGVAADLAYGPQNRLWLTEGGLGVPQVRGVNPSGGSDITYPLGNPDLTGMNDPQGIAVGPDGRLWVAGGSVGQRIAAVDPATGAVVSFALSGAPTRIAAGSDNNLWITLKSANAIAKVSTAGITLATYPLAAGAAPFDITSASDGALWFTESGAAKIGRLTTTGVLTEYAIGANAWDIAANLTDIWFTERSASKVGHLTTLGVGLFETATPTPASGPWGITVGSDGGIWFTEHDAAKVGRLDPILHTIDETLITTSSVPPTEMLALPDGTVWFANEANHLEHFKPNPDGTVGPLPPAIALTAGTPVQTTPTGPVYSTSTTFTIGATASGQCLDNVYYRVYLAGTTTLPPFTAAGTTATFSLATSGTWIVEFYGVGPGGQSLTQSVTLVVDQSLFVSDTIPPVITVPSNITTAATSSAGAVVTFTATALDAKDGVVPVTCTPPSGSTFAIGTTTVTCTAKDKTGNLATSTFTVTVTPGPPVVSVPANIFVAATGTTTPVTFTAAATSPWGGYVPVTCTPPGTTQASPGTFTYAFTSNVTTTVTCVSAADAFGQTATASFTVTPITRPTLTLPANITVTATGPTTPVTFTATATAAGGGSLPVICTPPSGSGFVPGTTLVSCTASDRGVTSTGTFTVTVNAPAPTLTVPADITVVVTGTSAVVTYTATANSVTDGPLVPTCTPPSGSTFVLGTTIVTCTVTNRGVTTTRTFRVTVANTRPSTLTITSLPLLPQGATTVSAKLLGPGGMPIVGRSVTFTAGTLTVTVVTNASGIASATLALKPGAYALTATFAGDSAFLASTAKSALLVYAKDDNGNNNSGGNSGHGGNNGGGNSGGSDGRGGRERD